MADYKDKIYPWLEPWQEQLLAQKHAGRLAHAYLFHGPPGLGKRSLAEHFGRGLLCQAPDAGGQPCGECRACQWLQAGSHPDWLEVAAEAGKTGILVDQIRALTRQLGLKSHAGGYMVAIVHQAHLMNSAAANSLLKTLEEPTANTVIVLLTDQPSRLLATIRSRCQDLRFVPPPPEQVVDWLAQAVPERDPALLLALADGAPLRAAALGEGDHLANRDRWFDEWIGMAEGRLDAVAVAADWAEDQTLTPLAWMGQWLMDILRLQQADAGIRNGDKRAALQTAAEHLVTDRVHELLAELWQAQRLMTTSVNRQLLVEDLLIAWVAMNRQRRQRRRA